VTEQVLERALWKNLILAEIKKRKKNKKKKPTRDKTIGTLVPDFVDTVEDSTGSGKGAPQMPKVRHNRNLLLIGQNLRKKRRISHEGRLYLHQESSNWGRNQHTPFETNQDGVETSAQMKKRSVRPPKKKNEKKKKTRTPTTKPPKGKC